MANQPIKKFRISNWEGVVWDNKKEVNGTEIQFKTITLNRSYKKKDENIWRSEVINNIRLNDIGKIKAILGKLEDYLFFEAREHDKEESEDDE